MTNPKVIISVSGGCVTGVYADRNMKVILYDFDNLKDSDDERDQDAAFLMDTLYLQPVAF